MLDFNEFNLYLIRHGQSEVNALPDQIGQSGQTKLTELGKQQARLLGARLFTQAINFDYIFSSDYLRALDTALESTLHHQMSPIVPIISVPALREYSAGDWIGSNRREVLTDQVKLKMGYLNSQFLFPHGESMDQVERRSTSWLEKDVLYNEEIVKEAARRRQNKLPVMNIAAYSHGMTIKCILHNIMGFDKSFIWKLVLENTAISQLYFGSEGWRLISINDRAHLL